MTLGPIYPESQDAFGNEVSFIPLEFEPQANLDGHALEITLSQDVFNVYNVVVHTILYFPNKLVIKNSFPKECKH